MRTATIETALTGICRRHSGYTRTAWVECECGWRSPHYSVEDPRRAHAEHQARQISEWLDTTVVVDSPTNSKGGSG